jgi:MFS family permease
MWWTGVNRGVSAVDVMAKEEKGGMRNVYALGFVSFFTDISSEMVFSVLPIFILGLPGSSPTFLGLIEGIAEALSYGLRAVSGFWSDKFRRRKLMVFIGYGFSNIVKPLFAVSSTALEALIVRVGDRVGKGIRTAPRDALISESVSADKSGAAFGLHRTLDQSGAIIGPLLASGLMVILGCTVRDIFWLSFIPGTVALVLILFFVKETVPKAGAKFELLRGIRETLTADYRRLLVVVALFSVGAFNYSFILLNAQSLGVAADLIPLVYAVLNVAHTVIAIPAGRLSDRVGKEKVLAGGYIVFLVSSVLIFVGPRSLVFAYVVAAVYGLYQGVVETVQRAMVPSYAKGGLKGTAYGVYYLVVGCSVLISNTLVGWLWNGYGSGAAALYSVVTAALAVGAMMVFLKNRIA